MASTIGAINPFRYRGYYYDTETKLYYLNSRYYDPEVGRFINSDDVQYLGENGDFVNYNLFAYCVNNPVLFVDPDGHAIETVWDIISCGASVIEVVTRPSDPWAWAGLIGDIVDIAIPCVGGLGESIDIMKTTTHVIDTGDDIIDTAKALRRGAKVTDDLKDATGAYVILYKGGTHYIGKGGFQRAITSATQHLADGDKVSAIIWKSTSSKNSAFVTEYLLQSVFGVGAKVKKTHNIIWSPGKKLLKAFWC